jgi:hypothetical protein
VQRVQAPLHRLTGALFGHLDRTRPLHVPTTAQCAERVLRNSRMVLQAGHRLSVSVAGSS